MGAGKLGLIPKSSGRTQGLGPVQVLGGSALQEPGHTPSRTCYLQTTVPEASREAPCVRTVTKSLKGPTMRTALLCSIPGPPSASSQSGPGAPELTSQPWPSLSPAQRLHWKALTPLASSLHGDLKASLTLSLQGRLPHPPTPQPPASLPSSPVMLALLTLPGIFMSFIYVTSLFIRGLQGRDLFSSLRTVSSTQQALKMFQ